MKTLAAWITALGMAGLAHAQRPLVVEESSIIQPPPGVEYLAGDVGLDGSDAVALGFVSYPSEDGYSYITITSAYLFRRSGATWTFVRKLIESDDDSSDDATNRDPVAMKNGVLALAFEPMYVFERAGGDWVQKRFGPPPGQLYVGHEPASDVEIDGGRIFIGDRSWGGGVLEKDPASGNWVGVAGLAGDSSGDGDNSVGGDVDISPNWAVVSSPYNWDDLPAPAMHVFHRVPGSGWPLDARLVAAPGHTFGDVAIRDGELFIGDFARFGVGVWRRDQAGTWSIDDRLRTATDFTFGGVYSGYSYGNAVAKSDPYVFKQVHSVDRNADVINVFQKNANGFYRHVAILVAKNGGNLGGNISASGRGVLVDGTGGPHYFELPASFAQPELFQDTFATGNGLGWTPIPGSQFSVVQGADSRVFRQSSTAGDAGAVLDAHDWTNQSIQAEIRPTAVNGADRWVGLATRRTDASNYYYVTLRSSGIIQLKRRQGGASVTLDSASVPWTLNRNYRLRLESVGTLQRVYLDGSLLLEAWDGALTHGQAALLSYRAAADYDNVIVSPLLTQTIYTADAGQPWDVPGPQPEPWTYTGTGSWQWFDDGSNALFRQSSTAGDARAVVGPEQIENTDQVIEARARPRTFGTTSGDPWFGVMARYADAANYVYVSLRRSNTLTLRKLVNGNIVQLGSAAVTVSPNTWYTLRLEAVGSQLRAYVNGRQVLEATDPQPSIGRVGLVDYRTAVDYDDIRAIVP